MEIPFGFETRPSHRKVCTNWWFLLHSASKVSSRKKAIINLKNDDDECFKWAITRALNPVEKNSEHIYKKTSRNIQGSQMGGIEISGQFERYQ